MNPRAAWRLESLGFAKVYDYVAGKADWTASGLQVKGSKAAVPRAGDVARRDVPTCFLDEPFADVRERVRSAGSDTCIVVNSQNVVLGRLGPKALESASGGTAEEVMEPGPSTVRPDVALEPRLERLRNREIKSALVTTPDGRLVGLVYREDAGAPTG
jgi:CBS domain-containing protein